VGCVTLLRGSINVVCAHHCATYPCERNEEALGVTTSNQGNKDYHCDGNPRRLHGGRQQNWARKRWARVKCDLVPGNNVRAQSPG